MEPRLQSALWLRNQHWAVLPGHQFLSAEHSMNLMGYSPCHLTAANTLALIPSSVSSTILFNHRSMGGGSFGSLADNLFRGAFSEVV